MNSEVDGIVDRATHDKEFASLLRAGLLRQCLSSKQTGGDQLAPEWQTFIRLFAARPQDLFKLRLAQIPGVQARRGRRTTATTATISTVTSLTVIVATPTAVTTLTTLTTTTTTAN